MYINKKNISVNRIIVAIIVNLGLIAILYTSYIKIIGEISLMTLLVFMSLSVIITPLFIVKDIFHPFIIMAITSCLVIIDFLNQDLFGFRVSSFGIYRPYSIIMIIVWYVFLYLGYYFSSKIRVKPINNRVLLRNNHPILIASLLFVLSLFGFAYSLVIFGGFSGMIGALVSTTTAYSGLGYLRLIVGLGGLSAILFLYGGKTKTSFLVILLTSLMLSFFGGRANVVLNTILPYLMYYNYKVKKLSIIVLSIFSIFSLLFIEILGLFRKSQQEFLSINGIWGLISNAAKETGMGTTLPWLVSSLNEGSISYQYGTPLLNLIYSPIPRTLWSAKPEIIDGSVLIAYYLTGSTRYGMPAGAYGEAFFNFGWLGVIMFSLITGYIINLIYKKFAIISTMKGNYYALIFYVLSIQAFFDFFITSSQIRIIWYVVIFVMIYIVDVLLTSTQTIKSGKNYEN